ncbi:hypothetical protein HGRIS_012222 [Hohenbuehelia grisea]|uniref:N-acetyltransferase domain-containing protein n=1 Tax=Hohenbuehelia grisea TaxID=104357 RepID=A0ABR3IRN1_9AGAR
MKMIVIRASDVDGYSNNYPAGIIERLISLSNTIFQIDDSKSKNASGDVVKYSSPAEWKRRLALRNGRGLIVACMEPEHETQSSCSTGTAEEKSQIQEADDAGFGKPIGFLFAHPRSHSDEPLTNGALETMHIWLAGVLPEFRRQGLLEQMVVKLMEEMMGIEENLTVCTVPARFPAMWGWLKGRGWAVEKEIAPGKFLLSYQAQAPTKSG